MGSPSIQQQRQQHLHPVSSRNTVCMELESLGPHQTSIDPSRQMLAFDCVRRSYQASPELITVRRELAMRTSNIFLLYPFIILQYCMYTPIALRVPVYRVVSCHVKQPQRVPNKWREGSSLALVADD